MGRLAGLRRLGCQFIPKALKLFEHRTLFGNSASAGRRDETRLGPELRTPSSQEAVVRALTLGLGILAFGITLAAFNFQDIDLWGKLAIGAHVWHYGTVPQGDSFAFTPVLPRYIEHEWGAGTIFFGVLNCFGPAGLMWLKILLAFGAAFAAMATARRAGAGWNAILLLALPAAACLFLGYVAVIRSHTFTYCFFGITLLLLERIRQGDRWPAFLLPPLLLAWSNIHGGFVAGLGTIGVYLLSMIFARQRVKLMAIVAGACLAATLVNIYGFEFWRYLVPALLHDRPAITEWRPLPLFGHDAFHAFRILFLLVAAAVIAGWKQTAKRSWPGLVLLAITAALAWRSRRHAPFFALTSLAFAGPFLESALGRMASAFQRMVRNPLQLSMPVLVVYALAAGFAAAHFLPRASFVVLAPVGDVPVREADILSLAQAKGNLATPFNWGGYCSWRLFPEIKVSMDSRYETAYPESTFRMNGEFFGKHGTNWDRLIREYPVHYVVLDLHQTRLRPQDLFDHGYELIWVTGSSSALMALAEDAPALRKAAAALPETTVDPVDAHIPDRWWR
jgi:hypothetical protein